jgi:hypothetical protein
VVQQLVIVHTACIHFFLVASVLTFHLIKSQLCGVLLVPEFNIIIAKLLLLRISLPLHLQQVPIAGRQVINVYPHAFCLNSISLYLCVARIVVLVQLADLHILITVHLL